MHIHPAYGNHMIRNIVKRRGVMLKGRVKKDEKTKELVRRLEPNDIAVLLHKDIDEVAARQLVKKKLRR